MKKAVLILAVLAFATPSFAAIIGTDGATTVIGGADFQPSKLVLLDLEAAASEYAAGSKHLNGSKCYYTRNDDSTINSADGVVGTDITDSMIAAATTTGTLTCQ